MLRSAAVDGPPCADIWTDGFAGECFLVQAYVATVSAAMITYMIRKNKWLGSFKLSAGIFLFLAKTITLCYLFHLSADWTVYSTPFHYRSSTENTTKGGRAVFLLSEWDVISLAVIIGSGTAGLYAVQ